MSKETLSTSDKEVPKIKLALEEKYEEEKKEINLAFYWIFTFNIYASLVKIY